MEPTSYFPSGCHLVSHQDLGKSYWGYSMHNQYILLLVYPTIFVLCGLFWLGLVAWNTTFFLLKISFALGIDNHNVTLFVCASITLSNVSYNNSRLNTCVVGGVGNRYGCGIIGRGCGITIGCGSWFVYISVVCILKPNYASVAFNFRFILTKWWLYVLKVF